MSERGPIQVACAADAAYLPHAAVMLASLFEFNPDAQAHVLLDENVAHEDRERLERWARERGWSITCSAPRVDLPARMPGLHSLTRAAWLRLFLPELLPAIDRILYLDVDLVVRDSLADLWATDLQGRWLGAVHDTRVSYTEVPHETRLQLDAGSIYFNSGVLLMDLDAFRREKVRVKAMHFAAEKPGLVKHADQDPLNVLLQSQRLPLGLRWNVQACLYENEAADEQPFSKAEIADAMKRPAIVHYCGPWKPWHYRSRHPLRRLYAEYRARTPWSDWALEGRTMKHRVLRLLPEPMARSLKEIYWSVRGSLTPKST